MLRHYSYILLLYSTCIHLNNMFRWDLAEDVATATFVDGSAIRRTQNDDDDENVEVFPKVI